MVASLHGVSWRSSCNIGVKIPAAMASYGGNINGKRGGNDISVSNMCAHTVRRSGANEAWRVA